VVAPRRGEVWWAEDPESDKRRPFLVLTRDGAIEVLHTLTVVGATRTIRNLPSEVQLSTDDGMPQECVLSFDNITRMPKLWLSDRICMLPPERMRAVCRALGVALGC
jgi:mRNA interferase MazF